MLSLCVFVSIQNIGRSIPLVIRLQKTTSSRPTHSPWPYVFKTSCRDVFFKTSCKNVFKILSRRFQEILKTSSRQRQGVFKRSSRHLQDVLQRCLQGVLKVYHQPRSHLEIYGQCGKFASAISFSITPWFQFFTLLHILLAIYRGVIRTLSNIYKGAFFAKILNGFKLLTIFKKKGSVADVRLG